MRYRAITLGLARHHGLKAVVRDNRMISKRRRKPSWWWVDLFDGGTLVMTGSGSAKRSGAWREFVMKYIGWVPKGMPGRRIEAKSPGELYLKLAAEGEV